MTQYLPEVEAIAREAGALLLGYFEIGRAHV